MERVSTAFRRSGYLFMLAFAFRLQLWLFAGCRAWTDLFRVDILNAMGFAMAVMSVMALFRTSGAGSAVRRAGSRDRAGRAAGVADRLVRRACVGAQATSSRITAPSPFSPGALTWLSA